MKKLNQGTRKPTTHFEQVPVKILKKIIAAEETKTRKARPTNVIVERASMKTEPYSMQFAQGRPATSEARTIVSPNPTGI